MNPTVKGRHSYSLVTSAEKTRKLRVVPSVANGDYLRELMAELDRAAISVRLGESLVRAGIRQHEMASLLHVHKRSVEDYVSPRKQVVPFDRLEEWAAATDTTTQWLLYGDDTDAPVISDVLAAVGELGEQLERIFGLLQRLLGESRDGQASL